VVVEAAYGLGIALDRLAVPAHERARVPKAVLDRPQCQGAQRFGRPTRCGDPPGGKVVERDHERGGHHRRRVVERARFVRERERLDTEEPGQRAGRGESLGGLARDRRPGPIQLFGPALEDESLQGMEAEPPVVSAQIRDGRRAARVRDPGASRDLLRDVRDLAVRDAEQDEVGVAAVEVAARDAGRDPLAEAGGQSFADASSADYTC
jgi:hypothetical protein